MKLSWSTFHLLSIGVGILKSMMLFMMLAPFVVSAQQRLVGTSIGNGKDWMGFDLLTPMSLPPSGFAPPLAIPHTTVSSRVRILPTFPMPCLFI